MATNYDDDMAVDPGVQPEGEGEPIEGGEDEDSPNSFLLDKAAFGKGEVKPGQTLTVKVVEVYEDDVEVEPVAAETSAKTPEPGLRERVGQRMSDRMMTMTS